MYLRNVAVGIKRIHREAIHVPKAPINASSSRQFEGDKSVVADVTVLGKEMALVLARFE